MSVRHQPTRSRGADRHPLSIRHEIDATLFGCVEAVRHEPDVVLTSAELALTHTVAQRGGAFNKGRPFAFVLAKGTESGHR